MLVFFRLDDASRHNGSKGKINEIERTLSLSFCEIRRIRKEFEEDDNKFSTGEKRMHGESERAKMKKGRERTDIVERG